MLTDELYYYYENPVSSTRKKWTVHNLDQIEAHEARVKYCEEKGLYKAFCRELEELVISYYTQAVELTAYVKEDPSCRTHLQALKPTLRPVLRRAKQHGLIPFNRTFDSTSDGFLCCGGYISCGIGFRINMFRIYPWAVACRALGPNPYPSCPRVPVIDYIGIFCVCNTSGSSR